MRTVLRGYDRILRGWRRKLQLGRHAKLCARREHDASGLQNGGHIDTKEIEACRKNNDTECPRDIQCRDGSNEPPNEECLDGDEELETAAVKLLHTYEAGGNTQDMLAKPTIVFGGNNSRNMANHAGPTESPL